MYGSQDPDKPPIDWETVKKIKASVHTRTVFNSEQCDQIEKKLNILVDDGNAGKFKECTVDRAPLRTKYFFGEGYTYGKQINNQKYWNDDEGYKSRGPGGEKLYPKGEVDPIPDWIRDLIIKPLEIDGLITKNWINSAVINDYKPGGCIVSHIDPPHLFERPILSVSFFAESALSFGCKFSFKPMRVSTPMAQVPVWRGCLLRLFGFAANEVTHCIRPEDTEFRRVVVILRHVPDNAPRMDLEELAELRKIEDFKRQRYNNRYSSRYGYNNHHGQDWRPRRSRSSSRQGTSAEPPREPSADNDKSEGEIVEDESVKERSPSIEILPRVHVPQLRSPTQSISSPEMVRRQSASLSPVKARRLTHIKKEQKSSSSSSEEEDTVSSFYKSRMRMDSYDNNKRHSFPFSRMEKPREQEKVRVQGKTTFYKGYDQRSRMYSSHENFKRNDSSFSQDKYKKNSSPSNEKYTKYGTISSSHDKHKRYGSPSPSSERSRRGSFYKEGESRYEKERSYKQDKQKYKRSTSPSPSPSPVSSVKPRLASTVHKGNEPPRKLSDSPKPMIKSSTKKQASSSPSSGPDEQSRRKRFVYLAEENGGKFKKLPASPAISSNGTGATPGGSTRREEGELSDSDSVTSDKRKILADLEEKNIEERLKQKRKILAELEEKSIENRLKNLDKKRSIDTTSALDNNDELDAFVNKKRGIDAAVDGDKADDLEAAVIKKLDIDTAVDKDELEEAVNKKRGINTAACAVKADELEAAEFEEELENLEKRGEVESQVKELRKELDKLKMLVKTIHDADKGKHISALDIITREVKTKINADYESTQTIQTILKMKLEKRKTILKNKLIKLKEEKEKGEGGDQEKMEFRKQKRSKEFRRKEGSGGEYKRRGEDSEDNNDDDVIGNAKKKMENKRLERKRQMKASKYKSRSRSSSRDRSKKLKRKDYSSSDELHRKIAQQLQGTKRPKLKEGIPPVKKSSWSSDSEPDPEQTESTKSKKMLKEMPEQSKKKARSKSHSLGPDEKLKDYKALIEIRERMEARLMKRKMEKAKSDSSPSPVRERKPRKSKKAKNVLPQQEKNVSPSPPPAAKPVFKLRKSAELDRLPAAYKPVESSTGNGVVVTRGLTPPSIKKMKLKIKKAARSPSASSDSDDESKETQKRKSLKEKTMNMKEKSPAFKKTFKEVKLKGGELSGSSRSPSPLVKKKKLKQKPRRNSSSSPSPSPAKNKIKNKKLAAKSVKKPNRDSSSDSIETKIEKLKTTLNKTRNSSFDSIDESSKHLKGFGKLKTTKDASEDCLIVGEKVGKDVLVKNDVAPIELKRNSTSQTDDLLNIPALDDPEIIKHKPSDIKIQGLEKKKKRAVKRDSSSSSDSSDNEEKQKRRLIKQIKEEGIIEQDALLMKLNNKKKKRASSSESSDDHENSKSGVVLKKKRNTSELSGKGGKAHKKAPDTEKVKKKKKQQDESSDSSDSEDDHNKKVRTSKKNRKVSTYENKELKKALLNTLKKKIKKRESSSESSGDEKPKTSKKKKKDFLVDTEILKKALLSSLTKKTKEIDSSSESSSSEDEKSKKLVKKKKKDVNKKLQTTNENKKNKIIGSLEKTKKKSLPVKTKQKKVSSSGSSSSSDSSSSRSHSRSPTPLAKLSSAGLAKLSAAGLAKLSGSPTKLSSSPSKQPVKASASVPVVSGGEGGKKSIADLVRNRLM